jgi:hypothetical protein
VHNYSTFLYKAKVFRSCREDVGSGSVSIHMTLKIEKDSSLSLGMTITQAMCHLEQSERSFPN